MPELPWAKWFPSDWASDPMLSMCDVSTQGVWMNAVNAMLLMNQPRISGTVEELSRVCRCRPIQFQAAICEIRDKKVGNVIEQNGNTTIECRRLLREHKIKQLRSKAGVASATKRQHHTQQVVSTNDPTPSASASASSSSVSEFKKEKRKASLEEVKLVCAKAGLPESDAIWFYNKCEGNGWTNGGRPIQSWPHVIGSWKAAGYMPSQKNHDPQNSQRPNPRNFGVVGDLAEISRKTAEFVQRQQEERRAKNNESL